MKCTDGLFLDVAREIAKEYPQIEFTDSIVDAMCMRLVMHPEEYDVLVCPNLYGDIVSDSVSYTHLHFTKSVALATKTSRTNHKNGTGIRQRKSYNDTERYD